MIRDVSSIILCLLITMYIVQRRNLPPLARLALLYAVLWLVNALISSFDLQFVKTTSNIRPGTILSYAFRTNPLSYYPIDIYRMLGDRYLHFALVVSHQSELYVMDSRQNSIAEFEPYRVTTQIKGCVYRIPLDTYLNYWKKSVIFRTYTPPETISLYYDSQILEQIARESCGIVICSTLCMRYLSLAGVIPGCCITLKNLLSYIPLTSAMKLLSRNWREDYFVVP
jgi:hypothetical protein